MLPISTKRAILPVVQIIEHIKKKKTNAYGVGNPDPGLQQAQKCGGKK
jgi:hypothetical protein